jgi:outer membrane protein
MERVMKRTVKAGAALLLAAAVAGGIGVAPAAAQQPNLAGPLRLAYVNSQIILANTPGRAEAESTLAREMAGARGEVERLRAQFDTAVATYNRTQVAMTPAARQTREGELRAMEQRMRDRAAELQQEMERRENELSAPIMQRVQEVINGIRAELNLSMVFDAANGGLLTADRSLDITGLVIQRLRAGQPPPATPPAAAPADSARPPQTPADTTRRPATPLRGRRP